MIFLIVQFDK